MSSLTDNQVVAFVLSVVACAVLYQGFELFGAMSRQGGLGLALSSLGMQSHYISMSRGVLDLRDVVYFLVLIVLFLALTVRVVGRNKPFPWKKYATLAALLVVAPVLASLLPVRLDLTSDKRYTLMPVTKQILEENRKPVYVRVYLTGELPAGFKRLEKSVKETLDEFRVYNPGIRKISSALLITIAMFAALAIGDLFAAELGVGDVEDYRADDFPGFDAEDIQVEKPLPDLQGIAPHIAAALQGGLEKTRE